MSEFEPKAEKKFAFNFENPLSKIERFAEKETVEDIFMSMLTRYKKSGGFKQILQLIETSGKVKQKKFLKMIRDEDPVWADEIEKKMLTFERILGWNEQVLAEIFSRQKDINLAICKHVFSSEQWETMSKTFSHSRHRKLDDLITEKEPSSAEKSTALVSLLSDVRVMITEGFIRLEQLDPDLIIEADIEEKLNDRAPAGDLNFGLADAMETEKKLANASSSVDLEEAKKEFLRLKKKMLALTNENANLRKDKDELTDKLAKIKKLVA